MRKFIVFLAIILCLSCQQRENIVTEARNQYKEWIDVASEKGFSYKDIFWSGKQSQMKLRILFWYRDAQKVIYDAQVGLRAFANQKHLNSETEDIINKKFEVLKNEFGSVYPIYESPYSVKETVNDKGYSNMFLSYLYFYSRIMSLCNPKSILEIGGGYGSLARIFVKLNPDISYTMVDLPEALFYANVFLNKDFGDNTNFKFVPVGSIQELYGKDYDLVLNTSCWQELNPKTVQSYADLVENKLKVRYLYSMNKEYIEGTDIETLSYLNTEKWNALYNGYNPAMVRIDTNPEYNWLEVLLKKVE